MDAAVRLAIMTKCQKVFEHANTFLSFPREPQDFTTDRLKFVSTGGATPQEVIAAREFAFLVNRIPRGIVFEANSEELLWGVYGDVLRRGQVASGTLTPEQQSAHDDAMALLYVPTEDGLRQESPRLRAYKQYRDAWIKAQEAFRQAQMTAEVSNDAAKLKQWREFEEPALRSRVAEAETEWIGLGFKPEIEAAQATEERIARSAPQTQWTEWKKEVISELDFPTDATGNVSFATTGFAPSDVVEQSNWTKFQLDRPEIIALAEEAPAELKALFQSQPPAPQIESVSFEFHSALAIRPWFRSDVFRMRFWRLEEGEPLLSDGETPPSGRCPAYVQALVFARNIMVTTRPTEPAPTRPPLILVPHIPVATPKPMPVRPVRGVTVRNHRVAAAAKAATQGRTPRAGAKAAPPKRRAPAQAKIAPRAARLTQAAAPIPPAQPAAPAPLTPARQAANAAAMARLANASFRALPEKPVAPPGAGAPANKEQPTAPTLRAEGTLRVASAIARPGHPAQPQPPQPVTTPVSPGAITVLAFICRRLPRSPDPDPDFNWS